MEIKEVEILAKLARIKVKEEEKESLAKDLSNILKYVAMVQEVSSEAPSEDGEFLPVLNVMRDDTSPHSKGEHTQEIIDEMPEHENNYLKVKKIL